LTVSNRTDDDWLDQLSADCGTTPEITVASQGTDASLTR
jgi:hypothetical protein